MTLDTEVGPTLTFITATKPEHFKRATTQVKIRKHVMKPVTDKRRKKGCHARINLLQLPPSGVDVHSPTASEHAGDTNNTIAKHTSMGPAASIMEAHEGRSGVAPNKGSTTVTERCMGIVQNPGDGIP